MARVPVYDNLNVMPSGGAIGRVDPGAISPQAAALPGRQIAELGAAVQGAGETASKILLQRVEEANRTRVTEALSRAKSAMLRLAYDPKEGYVNARGEAVMNRDSGKPLAEEYGELFNARLKEIEGSLTNDAQRAAFRQNALPLMVSFKGQALEHENREYTNYRLSVHKGAIQTSAEAIARNYTDPAVIDRELDALGTSVREIGTLRGISGEELSNDIRSVQSAAITKAIGTALDEGDTSYAARLFGKYKERMSADDVLKADGLITKQLEDQAVMQAVDAVLVPTLKANAPDQFERMVNITLGAESGNRDFDENGDVLTSPKGAKGRMQVLDSTNIAPGFGVKPAKDDSLEERARVGRDYLAALLKKFGTPEKAWAAYNAGPKALEGAMALAKSEGKPLEWLSYLPKETRDYVEGNVNRLQQGGGSPPPVTLEEAIARAEEKMPNATPSMRRALRTEMAARWQIHEASVKDQQDQATQSAIEWLAANDGNFLAMPASLKSTIPAAELPNVMGFAERLRKGEDTHDATAWVEFAMMSPTQLARLTPAQYTARYRGRFDEAHFERGAALISAAQAQLGKTQADPKVSGTMTVNETIKTAAISAGIIPPAGKINEDEAVAYNQFELEIDRRVRDFERNQLDGKRKANRDEIEQVIDGVLKDKVFVDEWGRDPQKPVATLTASQLRDAYVNVYGEEIRLASIPARERTQIIEALRLTGQPVTEQAIAELYVRGRGR